MATPVASPASAAPVLGTPITLPEGSFPQEVAFSPDGSKAYVANYGTDTVSVITVATNTLATPIRLPADSGPSSLAFSPDGSKAYVANYLASTVSVITVATDTLGIPITLPARSYPQSVAFSPDGSKAYVANSVASSVSVVTVATDTLGTPIPLPQVSNPTSVAFSPDGSRAYVTNTGASNVSVIITSPSGITSIPRTLKTRRTTTTSVTLRWNTPATLNGGMITDYVIKYRRIGKSRWLTFPHTTSPARIRAVTGLTPGTRYRFKVAAKTAAGTSPYTALVTKTTLAR